MIPPELRGFIPEDDFSGPPFYFHHRPGSALIAEHLVYWISVTLDSVPNREASRWKVWFSEMAYGMVKERFWPMITLSGYKEWIHVYSPNIQDWRIPVRIAGTEGNIEDITGDVIVDRVTIKLEIDDGDDGFMP
jgi:hypothetical protein